MMNRKILLTGALGTLGVAQAKKLAEEGGSVILLDLPSCHKEGASLVKSLYDQARGENQKFEYIGADLNEIGQKDLIDSLEQLLMRWDGVDVLINNAALIENRPYEEFDFEAYEKTLRINSSAAFRLIQLVARNMIQKQSGKIVNFCSITLNGRWEGFVPYVASKGAMLGLTKNFARELGKYNINVNAVSPGAIQSKAEERVFGDKLEEYSNWILENQSLKFRGQAQDVAELVAFLVSEKANYISGQNIHIDGGW